MLVLAMFVLAMLVLAMLVLAMLVISRCARVSYGNRLRVRAPRC